jgi:ribose 5-phosphate isomerase
LKLLSFQSTQIAEPCYGYCRRTESHTHADRSVDGKKFSTSKAYIIAGDGNYLLDYDTRGLQEPEELSFFTEIKEMLGIVRK